MNEAVAKVGYETYFAGSKWEDKTTQEPVKERWRVASGRLAPNRANGGEFLLASIISGGGQRWSDLSVGEKDRYQKAANAMADAKAKLA